MLQMSGREQFDQTPEAVWMALTRPEFLCRCFPGVDHVVRFDERSAVLVVRPGFSFVRGTLEVAFEFVETERQSANVQIQIKGIGSSAALSSSFQVAPDVHGTQVNWQVHATLIGGLLKAVSQGLIQAAAQKVAADTWAEVHKKIGSTN